MGNPIKSDAGVALGLQIGITGRVNMIKTGAITLPGQSILSVCENAESAISARDTAVSGAKTNLLRSTEEIGSLASRFETLDKLMGANNAQMW